MPSGQATGFAGPDIRRSIRRWHPFPLTVTGQASSDDCRFDHVSSAKPLSDSMCVAVKGRNVHGWIVLGGYDPFRWRTATLLILACCAAAVTPPRP
jgi:hypothetical protein